jgi:hypothetical protein
MSSLLMGVRVVWRVRLVRLACVIGVCAVFGARVLRCGASRPAAAQIESDGDSRFDCPLLPTPWSVTTGMSQSPVVQLVVESLRHADDAGRVAVLDDDQVVRLVCGWMDGRVGRVGEGMGGNSLLFQIARRSRRSLTQRPPVCGGLTAGSARGKHAPRAAVCCVQ